MSGPDLVAWTDHLWALGEPGRAWLGTLWSALSLPALIAGAGGIATIAVVALGLVTLPAWLSRPLLALGAIILVAAGLYEAGRLHQAGIDAARQQAAVAAAEAERARQAEAIAADLRARAAHDQAELAAAHQRLQELTDALDHDPARDRVAVPRHLSRRLRDL